MGFSAQVQSPQTGQTSGKMSGMPNTGETNTASPMGMNGVVTNSSTSGQPRVGQPNQYPNTVGMGDNSQQQPNQAQAKGKGV